LTDLTTVIDEPFLEFLQERLARLFKGKVSVVFEDLQSKPITGRFPKTRVFAKRAIEKGDNVCQKMIDCPWNEKAQLKCLLSDAEGAHMARVNKKGCFYRCHQGRGFPNLLFPIIIWPDEVVGYLYVGQIVFQKLDSDQKRQFLKRLKESNYIVENPERFVTEWTESDLLDFYEYIIESKLRKTCDYDSFAESILNQVENYGVSPDEFFDIVELVERLANELSSLGNSLYILNSLVRLEGRLPEILKAKHDSLLSELRKAIAIAVIETSNTEIERKEIGETIKQIYLGILLDYKKYEEDYLRELIEPYKLSIFDPNEAIQRSIVEFYARAMTFEVILYARARTLIGLKPKFQSFAENCDEFVNTFFNVLASCGKEFPLSLELVKTLFLQMYREKDVKFLLKNKLVPCMRLLFDDEQGLKDWFIANGIVDLEIRNYREKLTSFSRTFDLIVDDLQSLWSELRKMNNSLGKQLKKDLEKSYGDAGELMEYLRLISSIRVSLSKEFSDDRFGTRSRLSMKCCRVYLNSGGLTPTYSTVLSEQQKWSAIRNDEGPIGVTVEEDLRDKIEQTRNLVAKLINAEGADSIVFTENTTSSIDLVLRGVLRPGDEVLTTDLEHNVVYYLKELFEGHPSCDFNVAPICKDLLEGKDWLPKLISRIGQRTRLIILSHIPYGVCRLLPVKEIIKQCRQASEQSNRKMFILIDGAHAVGNRSVDVRDLGCDFYAFDGHKWLLGPEGTGLLYCKEEYLKANNPYGVRLPVSTAYMVSRKYAPKKDDGTEFELGTVNGAKIIGLGEAIQITSELRFSEILKWKSKMVRKVIDGLSNTRWRIVNPVDAAKTGMIILQIEGNEQSTTYERIAVLLERSNIIVRTLHKPPSIRICIHHFNNERDVEIALFHLKALLEGINIHIGNHKKIKERLTEILEGFLKPEKPREPGDFLGLNIFSIAGAGKSYVISRILEEFKKKNTIKSYFKIHAKDMLRNEKPEKAFASVIDGAWQKMPAIIFIDEADSLLETKQKGILGILNDEYERIMKDKKANILFVIAENDPYKIFVSASRRLKPVYFPLPDFETRLRYLQTLARDRSCSSKLLLTEIARLTEEYSMSDLKKLWERAIKNAKGMVLTPEHFQSSLQLVPCTASRKVFQKYTKIIRDPNLKPKLFTGEMEID